MNDQNSNNNSFFGNGNYKGQDYRPSMGNTYEYVFSSDNNSRVPPRTPKKKQSGSHARFLLLTLVLCVSCSFIAGFGGFYFAEIIYGDSSEDAVNGPPSDDELYNQAPQDILEKTDPEASAFGSAGEDVFSVSQVVQKVEDSVVVIDVMVTTGSSIFGSQTSTGSGSGVIISADGYIITCHHVVENATEVQVTLNSGTKYEATLIGSDKASDLAIIKIEPKETLTYVEQGCSSDLVVGEQVVAIGNPLGTLGGTVTDGIISATERNIQTSDGGVMKLLQTNAAINSGNSGGGLFNLDGQLIGIVNAKYAAEGVEGLAFAIPIDSAYEVQLDLIEYGYVRGIVDHGLEVLDVTAANLNSYYFRYQIDTIGVYVVSSEYNTDLKNKDRIVSVNGTAITTQAELESLLENCKVGDEITIVYSRDKKEYSTVLTLQEYVPDYVKDKLQ